VNCRQFERNVAAYVEGALEEDVRRLMDAHRRGCPACERLARVHELVLRSLDTAERVEAPHGLRERILAAAAEEKIIESACPFPWRTFISKLVAAAVSAAAGIAAFHAQVSRGLAVLSGTVADMTPRLARFDAGVLEILGKMTPPPVWERGVSILGEGVRLLVEPVTLPHLGFPLAPCFFIATAVLAWSAWLYFSPPFPPRAGIRERS